MEFVKLSQLVDQTFTINVMEGYAWKKWDNDQKKMLTADNWAEGYRKLYEVETDKGKLSLSSAQVGALLEAVVYFGTANLLGRTFLVKSNGKTGMDIRYFFNAVKEQKEQPKLETSTNYDEIPFN